MDLKNKEDKKLKNIIIATILIAMQFVFPFIFVIALTLMGINIDPNDTKTIMILNLIINLIFMFVVAIVYFNSIISDFKDFKANIKKYFKENIKYWLFGIVLMYIINIILIYYIYGSNSANESQVQEQILNFPFYMAFSIAIYAPFVEELIYRKSIRNVFNNEMLYILISGFLFGASHIAMDPTQYLYILPYGIVGAMFAKTYYKTDNIFVPIMFHFIHNLIMLLISLGVFL